MKSKFLILTALCTAALALSACGPATPDPDCTSSRGAAYVAAEAKPMQNLNAVWSSVEYHIRLKDGVALINNFNDLDDVLKEYQALTPPPLFKHYHDLQLAVIDDLQNAVNAVAAAGDYKTAMMKLLEATTHLSQAIAEKKKIQKICGWGQ